MQFGGVQDDRSRVEGGALGVAHGLPVTPVGRWQALAAGVTVMASKGVSELMKWLENASERTASPAVSQ